ncbi:MAG: hypothetical protein M1836_000188 [Candelina mexicana]|nr:MAG: hypothetical protein M1836_000188 [Candelina mexicana]
MNGDSNAPSNSSISQARTNGGGNGAAGEQFLSQVVKALGVIHDSTSSNECRKQASLELEAAKSFGEAPYHGYSLGSDQAQPPVIRHFGLSLLEHAIRHQWNEYSDEQSAALRNMVVQLAPRVNAQDPPYIRNKTAQLWVEVAERSWAGEWMDMDELLMNLWTGTMVQKEFVLSVLETLSEEIFNREDPLANLRGPTLSKACVDIFTPVAVLAEHFPSREKHNNVRSGDEGWLARLSEFLSWCTVNDYQGNEQIRICALRCLAALRAALCWAIPKAIAAANCVMHIVKSLAATQVTIQMAAIEALHALYSRSHFHDDEFLALICPMYEAGTVALLSRLYEWSIVDVSDIDESRYLLSKKLSEMVSNLANFIEQKPQLIPEGSDLPSFLQLLLGFLRSQSLVVSIPILNTWTMLLSSDTIGDSDAVSPMIGSLLETCSQRLLRYEALPEDSVDPTFLFLNEDIDTIPERHAFLGNYRRYCVQVVETIVKRMPFDAMYHILGQVDQMLGTLYEGQLPFQAQMYTKNSIPVLRVDAHFTVVDAALKGYVKWVSAHGSSPQEDEQQRNAMESNLEAWCQHLLGLKFEDPLLRRNIIKLLVEFSTKALTNRPDFALKVLEHILLTKTSDNPTFPAYSEAVRELQTTCGHELQRLGLRFADYFVSLFGQLQSDINQIISEGAIDDRQRLSLISFLFIITHRATILDGQLQISRLETSLAPIKESWQTPELARSLTSFSCFCDLLDMSRIQTYLASRRVHEVEDWSSYRLDVEGQVIQAELAGRFEQLPLRPTKVFLGQSTDKLKKNSKPYQITCSLWHDAIPIILPNLLQFISHAHAFHNPATWTKLPEELQAITSRVLTDRFWQAGISTGSKDEFYAKVSGTKSTLEGFASSIRGTIRLVRETCYSILFCMSRLDEHFYGFKELPGPLAHALFADSHALSSHQMSVLLNMVRYLIEDCPPRLRRHFLPPVMATMFIQMDNKVGSEWEKILRRNQSSSEGDDLTNEMKDESILRQLTYTSVNTVAGFLSPSRPAVTHTDFDSTSDGSNSPSETSDTMREFILSSPTILEPLILFCTHALGMRDSRCCGLITRVLSSIIPEFAGNTPIASEIREFISTEVLKACITSLHEPYFVDLQKDLAQLIATIFRLYSPKTETPRQILLSLPGITEEKVEQMARKFAQASNQRQQRGLILELLEGLRGVSISEQGRIKRDVKKERSAMQDRYMKVDEPVKYNGRESPDLGGVAGMFGA